METAKTLIRSIVRAFYETRHALVIDALMIHSALPNEDLALLLGMQSKDVRKLCGKLKEDRLLTVQSRPEIRDGMTRPINKEYYFIDFHLTIDAIKYRIFNLTEKVKEVYKITTEKKDYFCPQCHAEWTQLEVLDRVGPSGFECHRCDGLLERSEQKEGEATGHEKQSRLMNQLDKFLKLLQRIDNEDVPKNDFETAMAHAVSVKRNQVVNPLRPYQPVVKDDKYMKGMPQSINMPLDVSVTSTSEKTAAEKAEDVQRKAGIAAQNALPIWHTTSTVTGQSTINVSKDGQVDSSVAAPSSEIKAGPEEDDKSGESAMLHDELAAYYTQLAQEKEKEAQEDQEDGEDSSDEDDGGFEDVNTTGALAEDHAGTKTAVVTKSGLQEDRQEVESGNATPSAKRVRIDDGYTIINGDIAKTEPDDKESDEDDEIEFEDV